MTIALKAPSVLYAFRAVATAPMIWFVVWAKTRPFHHRGNPCEMQHYHRNEEHGKQASCLTQGSYDNFACHGRVLAIEGSDETQYRARLVLGVSSRRLLDFVNLGPERLFLCPAEDYVPDRTLFVDEEVGG